MTKQTDPKQQYRISVYEPNEAEDAPLFSLVSDGLREERGPNGTPKPVPQVAVTVRAEADGLVFDWSDEADADRHELEAEIAARLKDRAAWIDRVSSLVGQVEQWGGELGWATRRIEKKLDDVRIGKHRVPALLMQEGTCRILLEPVGCSTASAEGVVDLYLMPAYDDIASLYYYGDRWNIHYSFPGAELVATTGDGTALPLSKEALEKVLAAMTQCTAL